MLRLFYFWAEAKSKREKQPRKTQIETKSSEVITPLLLSSTIHFHYLLLFP